MGKNKLAKFDNVASYPHVSQYPFTALQEKGFDMERQWHRRFFENNHPIVLGLGCGRGEYTIGLGKLFPDRSFIGVDIKGARMWTDARESLETGMKNMAFLHTNIELISYFFTPGEVAKIQITFPDPQVKKVNKRLTGTHPMKMYREILSGSGIIHLKTDSNFMCTYTCEMVKTNHYPVLFSTDDLYHSNLADKISSIRTYYGQQWLDRDLGIKYIKFVCEERERLVEPDVGIELDPYRSFNRSKRSALASDR